MGASLLVSAGTDLFICSGLLQNALSKATVKELATLHGTKYTYGPGATTICEFGLQNGTQNTISQGPQSLSSLNLLSDCGCLTNLLSVFCS